MEDSGERTTLNMVVQPIKDIKTDFKRNLKYIILTLVVLLFYILASSFIIRLFQDNWSFLRSLYFTIINTTTVGFGDIVPTSYGGKVIACINSIAGLIFFGAIVALITLAFQPSSFSGIISTPISNPNNDNDIKTNKIAEGLVCLTELLSNQKNEKSDKLETDRMHITIHKDKEKEGACFYHIDVFIDIRNK